VDSGKVVLTAFVGMPLKYCFFSLYLICRCPFLSKSENASLLYSEFSFISTDNLSKLYLYIFSPYSYGWNSR